MGRRGVVFGLLYEDNTVRVEQRRGLPTGRKGNFTPYKVAIMRKGRQLYLSVHVPKGDPLRVGLDGRVKFSSRGQIPVSRLVAALKVKARRDGDILGMHIHHENKNTLDNRATGTNSNLRVYTPKAHEQLHRNDPREETHPIDPETAQDLTLWVRHKRTRPQVPTGGPSDYPTPPRGPDARGTPNPDGINQGDVREHDSTFDTVHRAWPHLNRRLARDLPLFGVPRAHAKLAARIVRLLEEEGGPTAVTRIEAVVSAAGRSRRLAYRLLSELASAGLVVRAQRGRYVLVAEVGA